jgi:FG-GAP repeat
MLTDLARAARVVVFLAMAAGVLLGTSGPARAQFLEPDVQVLYTLRAESPGDFFGFVGAAIGDLNGDGAPEFLIGSTRHATGGPFAGRAYVFSGRDGALLNTVTGNAFNRLGFSVAGVGDINEDGTPDYAVGGPGHPAGPLPQNGRVVVLSGKDHSVIYDLAGPPRSSFGYDIGAAGDVNGDSYPDIIVGAPTVSGSAPFSGRVYIISGRDGSTLWTQDGLSASASLGSGVSGVGDLDGDGLPEQAVGASGEVNGQRNSGRAYVLSGRNGAYLRTLKPASTACDFGDFFVHASGDVDRDGVPDIFVSDYCDNRLGPGTGRAYVFSGSSEEKLRVFGGENAGDGFGPGRPVPDLDGDGAADFFIGAYTSSAGAPSGGKLYLYSGKAGKVLRTMTGTTAGNLLGFDGLPLGDVNADGRTDFLITGVDVAHVVAGDR